jgi:hypothetical protein
VRATSDAVDDLRQLIAVGRVTHEQEPFDGVCSVRLHDDVTRREISNAFGKRTNDRVAIDLIANVDEKLETIGFDQRQTVHCARRANERPR